MIDNFWPRFIDWHVRTDHPWDLALSTEAMRGSIISIQIELADRLSPIFERVAAQMKAILG